MSLRLLPLLMVAYMTAYIDRTNIGFAALQMNADLQMGQAAFGLGAGLFYIGYCLFEVPSNLALKRYGARRWLARIMLTWGFFAAAMAFVQDAGSFQILRFLLGAAEAGFYPGVVYYLSLWFPSAYRGRILGLFMAAIPVSGMIGGPLSGLLLSLDGLLGFQGWQWLLFLEALPAIGIALVLLRVLTDTPDEATWLSAEQKAWLKHELAEETQAKEQRVGHISSLRSLFNPVVLGLSIVYFVAISLNSTIAAFLPQVIKSSGLDDMETGFAAFVPSLFGLCGLLWWSRRSDLRQERKWHTAIAMLVGAGGLAVAAVSDDLVIRLAGFSIALAGLFAAAPCFWGLPAMFLSGTAAAAGIAAISSFGALGGFAAPWMVGYLAQATGSFAKGQLIVAGAGGLTALLLILLGGQRFQQHPFVLRTDPPTT